MILTQILETKKRDDNIKTIYKDLQEQKVIECLGRGRNAKWHRTGN
jgi:hypothetical protein